jgi:hypothetical protein
MSIIIVAVVAFLIIIGFTTFILVMAFRGKGDKSIQSIDYSDSAGAVSPIVSRINWSENNRGFSSTIFAPCSDAAPELKKLHSLLKGYNLEKKYMMLLDVYSMLMCQESQVRSRQCSDTYINDRLADLNTYGGNPNDQNAVQIVKSVTNLQNNKMGKLLVMATNLIEAQMKEIQGDNQISKSDKEQISGYNSLFYRQHYDFMNKRCP